MFAGLVILGIDVFATSPYKLATLGIGLILAGGFLHIAPLTRANADAIKRYSTPE